MASIEVIENEIKHINQAIDELKSDVGQLSSDIGEIKVMLAQQSVKTGWLAALMPQSFREAMMMLMIFGTIVGSVTGHNISMDGLAAQLDEPPAIEQIEE